mmetsp:Transcript_61004/g.178418  ORF Transcript_61004/g.178418 Transcript_61004/m.178418 type:complete len:223 (+) Transcript_61004:593-1261(+)
MPHQEAGVEGVHARHPDEAPPLDLVARAVDDDVDGAQVADLPHEELHQVEVRGQGAEEKAVVQATVELVGSERIAEPCKHPEGHAEPAVDEALHVHAQHLGVQLGPPRIVDNKGSRTTGVLGGRPVDALEVEEQRKKEAKDIEGSGGGWEEVIYHPKIVESLPCKVGPAKKQQREEDTVPHAIVLVRRDVSSKCLWPALDPTWAEDVQHEGKPVETNQELAS